MNIRKQFRAKFKISRITARSLVRILTQEGWRYDGATGSLYRLESNAYHFYTKIRTQDDLLNAILDED